MSVTTREYKHRPALNLLSGDLDFGLAAFLNGESNALDALLRGGKGTADHVDILGNYEVRRSLHDRAYRAHLRACTAAAR